MTPAPPFRFARALGLVGERPRNSATYRRGQARWPSKVCRDLSTWALFHFGFLSGIIRQNWNDAEKISMAPAQG